MSKDDQNSTQNIKIFELLQGYIEGCFGGTWYMRTEKIERLGESFFQKLNENNHKITKENIIENEKHHNEASK